MTKKTKNSKKATKPTPPETIEGVKVHAIPGSEVHYMGQVWVTMIPSEGEDSRIWEFSLTTGRIFQTAS